VTATPLEPRGFFAAPMSGEGEWRPFRRRFRFRSFTTWLTDDVWLVHDETTWEDGRVERRDGVAVRTAPDRIRFTYDDMPGGTELTLRADGFDFAPYVMAVRVPLLPVAVLVHCVDRCDVQPDGTLVDEIRLSLLGVPLGRLVMRLSRES